MQSAGPIRFLLAASFTFAALLPAQSTPRPQAKPTGTAQLTSSLPATPPTTTPVYPLRPSEQPPKRAQVAYANNTLAITADNSSLNQILRQISSMTGVKITGGVIDERVFGQYGPAPLPQILAELLDGTGSNILFTHPDGATSPELILTPRQGGPTPPNPNTAAFDDKADSQDSPPDPQQQAIPAEPVSPGNRTIVPITPASPNGATPADASQPDSPNGVKTPQQIYEQLQRMRQQQPQPTPPQ